MNNQNRRNLTRKVARTAARRTAAGIPRAAARGVMPQNAASRHGVQNRRNVPRGRAGRQRAPRGILLSVLGWLWAGLTAFVLIMYAINTNEINPVIFGIIFFGSIILFIVLTAPIRRWRARRMQQIHQGSIFQGEPFNMQTNPVTQTAAPPITASTQQSSIDEIADSLHGLPYDEAAKRLAEATGVSVDKVPVTSEQLVHPELPQTVSDLDVCIGCAAPKQMAAFCEFCGTKLR